MMLHFSWLHEASGRRDAQENPSPLFEYQQHKEITEDNSGLDKVVVEWLGRALDNHNHSSHNDSNLNDHNTATKCCHISQHKRTKQPTTTVPKVECSAATVIEGKE